MTKLLQLLFSGIAMVGMVPVYIVGWIVQILPGVEIKPGSGAVASMVVAPILGIAIVITLVILAL